MGKLYLVPTPIGNLEDITLRAIRILKEVDFILAEDTRKSGILLKRHDIKNKLSSYHKFNEHSITKNIINKISEGQNVALISDSGTPSISDPGYLIVVECIKNELEIECLPGASSILPALVLSGLPNDRFVFEGFLPKKKGRQTRLKELAGEKRTMVFFESPHRLVKTLQEFSDVFGNNRNASVSRELTKIYEENKRGGLEDLINYFSEKTVKGEIVIVVEGKK